MQLHRFRREFLERDTQVLVIGFESEERARAWIRQVQLEFPFLVDNDRDVYRAYGLERSVVRSWHPRILWFYFKRLLRGKGIPVFRADPTQLGGDILIDRMGRIRLAYAGGDVMDRPSIDLLLGSIDSIPTRD